ncbi:uncharacterized protein LOC127279870 [Leptopilina boulardi]|uniref:uncharacterized protein LOC127279870 n=1 Tax=Leptopilina boulardi TaxID=63433 RepID=UPI0021F57E32|nr:uncharacterized protein LOC127279870 [Leptopilina boulardi]
MTKVEYVSIFVSTGLTIILYNKKGSDKVCLQSASMFCNFSVKDGLEEMEEESFGCTFQAEIRVAKERGFARIESDFHPPCLFKVVMLAPASANKVGDVRLKQFPVYNSTLSKFKYSATLCGIFEILLIPIT